MTKVKSVGRFQIGFAIILSPSFVATAAMAGETVTYTYDALGRVVGVSHAGSTNTGVAGTYRYDNAGNRIQVVVSGASGGPIMADSSFEDPSLGNGFAYTPAVNGVAFNGGAGVGANGSAFGFATAPNGNQVAFIQSASDGAGTIDQTLSGLVPGRAYHLSVLAAQRPGYATNPIVASVGGVTILNVTPLSAAAFTAYTTQSFTAASATIVIRWTSVATAADAASAIDLAAAVAD